MACLLAILAYLPVDTVSHFADGVVIGVTERVLVGGVFHENGDGRVHAAGHTVGRRKERVVAGSGGAERVRTRIAVWIGEILRVKHHAHNGQFGREARCLVVRFTRIGQLGPVFARLVVRFCRIGHGRRRRRSRRRRILRRHRNMVALFISGILDEFARHRNLAGLFRHTATLQIRLVNAIRADLLHGHGFFAVQIDRHGLRTFALHFRNTGNLTERGNIVVSQSGRRQHLNIVQSLGVEKTIRREKSVSASRVNAGKHGNAQQCDHGDGDESLPRMQPHTHHVFDECHDDLQPRSVQAASTIALKTLILLDYRTIEHYETESTRYSYNRGRRAMPKTIGASPTTTAERNIAKIVKSAEYCRGTQEEEAFMSDATVAKKPRETDDVPVPPTLRKSLKNRHIQLIALGGAIGTGLFYGSSESIQLAGPAILLAYLIGGLAIFLIVRALSEMAVEDPKAGAFSYYATQYWSKRAGFISGWNYWFNYVLVAMVELAVVGSFVNYWFPNIPKWVSAAVFLVAIAALNLMGVNKFGEFEFWFAIIKIVAVLAMIFGGLYVIIANVPTASGIRASFANWFTVDGGFLPHGLMSRNADGTWTGLLMALVVVMFSFGGTELIGITAGETENPRTTIPKATNGIIWRILVFYICALGVIMAVVPWSTIDGNSSPFVQIFDSVGVHAAAGILNFVCLTAVMSVYNSGLYANSRMLYSLAKQGNAPAYLGRLNKRGVPVGGVITSAIIIAIAVVVVFVWPDFAFNYLMSIATIAAAINWIMIMITEIKFRRVVAAGDGPNDLKGLKGQEALDKLAFKLPFAKVTPYVVIAFMLLVVVLMCFSASYRIAVVAGVIWLVVLFAAYQITQKRA